MNRSGVGADRMERSIAALMQRSRAEKPRLRSRACRSREEIRGGCRGSNIGRNNPPFGKGQLSSRDSMRKLELSKRIRGLSSREGDAAFLSAKPCMEREGEREALPKRRSAKFETSLMERQSTADALGERPLETELTRGRNYRESLPASTPVSFRGHPRISRDALPYLGREASKHSDNSHSHSATLNFCPVRIPVPPPPLHPLFSSCPSLDPNRAIVNNHNHARM